MISWWWYFFVLCFGFLFFSWMKPKIRFEIRGKMLRKRHYCCTRLYRLDYRNVTIHSRNLAKPVKLVLKMMTIRRQATNDLHHDTRRPFCPFVHNNKPISWTRTGFFYCSLPFACLPLVFLYPRYRQVLHFSQDVSSLKGREKSVFSSSLFLP